MSRGCRTKGEGHVGSKQKRPGKGESPAVTGGAKEIPAPAANTPSAESPAPEPSEDDESPEEMTPEQEAAQETQKRLEELLGAYQETLDMVEDLPAVVWVPWDRKRPGSYLKVPYL